MAAMEESTTSAMDVEEEKPSGALLRDAERLYDLGCSAIRNESYDEAVDCLTKALEIRVQHYGELGPECARTYYKLGCALLYKVQAESDPLVDRQEQQQQKEEEQQGASSGAAEGSKQAEEEESDEDEEDEEEKNPGEGAVAEDDTGEEEDNDLELAWKMLDIARVIYAKEPQRTLEEVDVITTLADVSLEKELFQLCFEDYYSALSALEGLVEGDNRRIAELCFKISLAKQLDQKPREALDFCKRAISVCEHRVERLTKGLPATKGKKPEGENGHAFEDVEKTVSRVDEVEPLVDGADAGQLNSSNSSKEQEVKEEVKELEDLLVDLREKVEDLQQMTTAPTLLEAFKTANPEAAAMVTQVYSASLGVTTFDNGGAHTTAVQVGSSSSTAPVTNLGVMGRGVKRATLVPIKDDQLDVQPKKRTLEDVRNGGSSGETQIGFNSHS